MQITRTDVDALNAKVAISIEQNDFAEKVENILKDYRKSANILVLEKVMSPWE